MLGLQNFVKGNRNGRSQSPQNSQPKINPQRASVAANLKLPMKPEVARPPTGQGAHRRGDSIAEHQSVPLQQKHLPRAPSGEGRNHDPYDTDAESLDTTVNRSAFETEHDQQPDRQQFPPDNEEHESGDKEEEEEASDENDSEDEERFPDHVEKHLHEHGWVNAPRDEQIRWLRETQPHIFATIDGDSYPSTTDGNPTEVDEQQEQLHEELCLPSPSPQRFSAPGSNAQMSFQQHQQQGHQPAGHVDPVVRQNSRIYRQGAQIRGQQRIEGAAQARVPAPQQATFELPTSQPPTHSQANQEHGFAVTSSILARPNIISQGAHSGFLQQSSQLSLISGHTQNPVPRIVEPVTTSARASAPHARAVHTIQQPIEPLPVEPMFIEEHQEYRGDYEPDVLAEMQYDELKNEDFDKDPREQEPVLPEDIRDQPLHERLQFAQQALHPNGQAMFFRALPTDDWEGAGDWFLDQFSAIITRTKEARKKKRAQAQAFEKRIEDRHHHVAKKQRLVQNAMAKMQAQGEGLVPKSPRASKSPRLRQG